MSFRREGHCENDDCPADSSRRCREAQQRCGELKERNRRGGGRRRRTGRASSTRRMDRLVCCQPTVEQDLLVWLILVVRACARTRADCYSPCPPLLAMDVGVGQPDLGKLGKCRSRTSSTPRDHDPPAGDDTSDSPAAGQMDMGLQRQGLVPGRDSQPGRRRCAATCPPDPLRKPKAWRDSPRHARVETRGRR